MGKKIRENINLNGPISSNTGAGRVVAARTNVHTKKFRDHLVGNAKAKGSTGVAPDVGAYIDSVSDSALRNTAHEVAQLNKFARGDAARSSAEKLHGESKSAKAATKVKPKSTTSVPSKSLRKK